jgi:4-amino-4-deoxy-L-arabinose transferase-like glycosyltransferase
MHYSFYKYNVFCLIFFGLIAWALLYQLDAHPMYLWDESRQANNALEMMQSGNYLYPTYLGKVDFWNTKPHLLIILQAVCMKILGPGLLALRLPSAIAGILVCFIWFRFLVKRYNLETASLAVFILITCGGFNVYHITRTGDYDALLLLFFTLSFTQFYKIIWEEFKTNNCIAFYIYISAAMLTKSFAALIWLPGFFIGFAMLFATNKTRAKQRILTMLRFIWIPILLALGYYGCREIINPGYLAAVWENEVAVRYFAPNEGHVSSWDYYFKIIGNEYFYGYWIVCLIAFFGILKARRKVKKEIAFYALYFIVFVGIITLSKTRIHWYLAPAIPVLSVITALAITQSFWDENAQKMKQYLGLIMYLIVVIIGVYNWNIIWENENRKDNVWVEKIFQRAEITGKFRYTGIWLGAEYNPVEEYYHKIFERKKIPFRSTNSYQFKKGDTVIFHRFNQADSLGKYYINTQIQFPDENFPAWVFRIDSVIMPNK